uniref:Autophagy-related protein 16 domain-containing protein n=1 Tax=Macaca fascicularis TaxID=9541 RepID=A0A2K5WWS0_MACFA
MAGPGVPGAPVARWKRHIVWQLRLRDRMQKALFLELVPAYNHLLEKAELLDKFSKKLQPEPNSVTPTTHQGPWEESGLDSDQVPSLPTLRVKWQEEEEGLRLVCGEGAPLHPGHPCAGSGHLPEPQPRPAAPAQLFPRQHTQGHRPACQQHPPGVQGWLQVRF